MVAFSWKLFHNRIPTRLKLARRNVLPLEASTACVLCDRGEELSKYLFLHCEVTGSIWQDVMNWLEIYFISPPNLLIHWDCWGMEGRNKKARKGLWLIWHTTL